MIKTYEYDYNWGDASAKIEVDTDKLPEALLKEALNFFLWDYDPEEDAYDELGRLYCRQAMNFATANNHNTYGVILDFGEAEGFIPVDGSQGITLLNAEGINFSELEIERVN